MVEADTAVHRHERSAFSMAAQHSALGKAGAAPTTAGIQGLKGERSGTALQSVACTGDAVAMAIATMSVSAAIIERDLIGPLLRRSTGNQLLRGSLAHTNLHLR